MATPKRTPRIDAMLVQLDMTSASYIGARDEFDAARVNYEVAREKFASVRRIAKEVLSPDDWHRWLTQNNRVQYTGLKIGEAITEALDLRAFIAANDHYESKGKVPFRPGLTLEEIQEALERGGFEFRTTTPLREVNAALINLDRVAREGKGYQLVEAEQYLEMLKPAPWGEEEAPADEAPSDADEVPF